jgi:hypothetical protein
MLASARNVVIAFALVVRKEAVASEVPHRRLLLLKWRAAVTDPVIR